MPIKITRLVFDGLPDDVDPNSLIPLEWDEQGNVKNWAMNLLGGESGEEFDTVGPNDVDVMMKVGRRMFRAEELLRAQMEAVGIKALPEYPAAADILATTPPLTTTETPATTTAAFATGSATATPATNTNSKTRPPHAPVRPRPRPAYATGKGRQLRLLVPSSSRFLYVSGWVLVACLGILIMVLLAMLILRPSAFAFFGFGFGTSPAATTAPAPATPVQVQLNLKSEVVYRLPISLSMFSPLETSFTSEANGEATGTAQIPDGTAQGSVRLLNLDLGAVTLPVGTTVATSTATGIAYKLTRAVNIPGLDVNSGRTGLADAPVMASRPGPEGNLPGGIGNYLLRGSLRVVGLGPIAGGSTKTVKVVTAQDIEKVKAQLNGQLDQKAKASLDGLLLLIATPPLSTTAPPPSTTTTTTTLPGGTGTGGGGGAEENLKRLEKFEVLKTEFSGPAEGTQLTPGTSEFKYVFSAQITGWSYRPNALTAQAVAAVQVVTPAQTTPASTVTTTSQDKVKVSPPGSTSTVVLPGEGGASLISDLALQVQAPPLFSRIEEKEKGGGANNSSGNGSGSGPEQGELTLVYTRRVNPEPLRAKLSGWTGSRAAFEELLDALRQRSEVVVVVVTQATKATTASSSSNTSSSSSSSERVKIALLIEVR